MSAAAAATEEIKNGYPMEAQIKKRQSLEISIRQSFPFIIGPLFIPTLDDNFQIDLLPTSSLVQEDGHHLPKNEPADIPVITAESSGGWMPPHTHQHLRHGGGDGDVDDVRGKEVEEGAR